MFEEWNASLICRLERKHKCTYICTYVLAYMHTYIQQLFKIACKRTPRRNSPPET